MTPRRFFLRSRRDAEVTQEIQTHIAEETAENVARGMSAEEARRRAYLKFGNPEIVREQVWQQNTLTLLDSLWRDLKYAARSLRRAPAFSVMAIFVMALGIGGTVAMFTVVRNVLLNPLPYPESQNLYALWEHEDTGNFSPNLPVAGGSFLEWQKAAKGSAELALVSPWQGYNVSAEGGKLPEMIDSASISWNFFRVLGVQPALGRDFTADDDRKEAPATVILAHSFWVRRYSHDPNILGKSIYLDAKPYTVIGVLPESFTFSSAMSQSNAQAVWTTVGHEMPELLSIYDDHEFFGVARLAKGVTFAQLMSRVDTAQKQVKAEHPGAAVHPGAIGHSMLDDAVAKYKTPFYALLAATLCVLLIACLNVASLLVARIAARSKEHAIRAALGGSRLRLLRERLTESLLLSTAGGAIGVLMAWGALRWLVLTRHDINRIETIHLDGFAFAFSVGAVLFAACFSALIAWMSADDKRILATLQESSRSHSAGGKRATLRRVLLVGEVGLTVVLLVGAGLLLKSYLRLRSTDLGIPVDNVLTLRVILPDARYSGDAKPAAFFEQLLQRVKTVPGVEAAALISRAPGQGWGGDSLMTVVEHPPLPKGVGLDLQRRGADPGYFAAAKVPMLKGRTFRDDERLDHAQVLILSESAVKLCFPAGDDPIGKHMTFGDQKKAYEVIGVVGDTRWDITTPAMPTFYLPIYSHAYTGTTVMVRASHNVESLAMPIQRIIGEMDPDLPVSGVLTLQQTISRSTMSSQFDSLLVLAFAAIALVLAAAGLYGVLAYLVTQRTGEIGVRIALGARREQVLGMVLVDGLRPALLGLVLGLAGSAATAKLIESMLYQTKPFDIPVFAAVIVTLLAMAALACLYPAWRASRLDPAQALRME
ncbi:ABC efflux pump, inner membrane subunit [Candidatus Koribacter versatilis Ellin345]|uniref:ABC efflux pump, inner membrane subunit n=1 Tax=Koribacter versatilis (strain Ellin345) TaxID=204669 RepID=Q1IIA5_KORVE|nr:ABC transporter permease [Candidatus Koribacter versatilis]ABF43395.1 ABC efflux pump, inner membrane subunit [Candidatus Koribacter versatilis Ellin345]